MAVFFEGAARFERSVQRARDAANLAPLGRRGVAFVLRASTQQLRALYPAAVPSGAGSWSDDEVIAFWAADPVTPIRSMLNYSFTTEPGLWDRFTGGLASGWSTAWTWIGAAIAVVIVGLVVGFIVWIVRR